MEREATLECLDVQKREMEAQERKFRRDLYLHESRAWAVISSQYMGEAAELNAFEKRRHPKGWKYPLPLYLPESTRLFAYRYGPVASDV